MINDVQHLLVCLAEECSEVQKDIMKSLRFGLDDHYPDEIETNAERISIELNDLIAIVEMLSVYGVLTNIGDEEAIQRKKRKVLQYMQYARERGSLE